MENERRGGNEDGIKSGQSTEQTAGSWVTASRRSAVGERFLPKGSRHERLP